VGVFRRLRSQLVLRHVFSQPRVQLAARAVLGDRFRSLAGLARALAQEPEFRRGRSEEFMEDLAVDAVLYERLAEEAWKKAEEAITGAERKERVAFSQQLVALGRTLRNLEAPIVEDEAVKGALDGLYRSLERAVEGTDAAVERGRASVEIQGYAQNLNIAMTAASAKRSDASAAAEMMSHRNAGAERCVFRRGRKGERRRTSFRRSVGSRFVSSGASRVDAFM